MDYKGTSIRKPRGMTIPEPDLEVRERAVPAEDLDHKGKGERSKVNDLHGANANARDRPEDQKDDPEEMDRNNNIGKDPENHSKVILPYNLW